MNLNINNHSVLEIILVTFIASVLLVPIAKRLALYIGALDVPNERKVHKVPIPRLGGLAIFGAFLLGYILYGEITTQMISILIGSFIIFLVGVFDDIKPIAAKYKFLVQLVAASIVVIYGQVYFNEITFIWIDLKLSLVTSYIFSILFIVAISNAINLIDGLDGLSSGVSSIYFLTIIVICVLLGKLTGLDMILSLIMLGATLGFLVYNFPPAKIFMGDSGSLFLGFMISIISLMSFKVATFTSLIIPIVTLSIPIFDTVLAIFRRLLKGESIGTPDKEHFHHQLLKLKFSTKTSVLIIYMVNTIFSVVSIFYVKGYFTEAIIVYVILMIALLFVILKTDILYNHHKDKNNKGDSINEKNKS